MWFLICGIYSINTLTYQGKSGANLLANQTIHCMEWANSHGLMIPSVEIIVWYLLLKYYATVETGALEQQILKYGAL